MSEEIVDAVDTETVVEVDGVVTHQLLVRIGELHVDLERELFRPGRQRRIRGIAANAHAYAGIGDAIDHQGGGQVRLGGIVLAQAGDEIRIVEGQRKRAQHRGVVEILRLHGSGGSHRQKAG